MQCQILILGPNLTLFVCEKDGKRDIKPLKIKSSNCWNNLYQAQPINCYTLNITCHLMTKSNFENN